MLDAKGSPGITERAWMFAPGRRSGRSPTRSGAHHRRLRRGRHYEKALDRESAFEMLKARAGEGVGTPAPRGKKRSAGGSRRQRRHLGRLSDVLFGSTGPRGGKREGVVDALAKSAARSVGSRSAARSPAACSDRCSGASASLPVRCGPWRQDRASCPTCDDAPAWLAGRRA